MKIKLILAFVFFALGTTKIIDWFIFWEQNRKLALKNRNIFITKYIERFPDPLKSLFTSKFLFDTFLSILLFSVAGLIFLKEKKGLYTALAIISFILAFWNLFSLM